MGVVHRAVYKQRPDAGERCLTLRAPRRCLGEISNEGDMINGGLNYSQ